MQRINQDPAEPVTITDDDWQSTDSWKMKTHGGKTIHEILAPREEDQVEENLNAIHDNGIAGRPNTEFKKKTGKEAPPSIHELVNIVKFLQYLKKVPENSTFVIVSAKEKIFIITLR